MSRRAGDICSQCGQIRRDHGSARHRTGACNVFYRTPKEFDYRPTDGDRGPNAARFATKVTCYVEDATGETVEVHTYHEAELRSRGRDHRTGMQLMQLVMPYPDKETGDYRDVDGDRAYMHRYLQYTSDALEVQGGAWISISGWSYFDGEQKCGGSMSAWDAQGPYDTVLIRRERWHQMIPEEAITDTSVEDEPPADITVYE